MSLIGRTLILCLILISGAFMGGCGRVSNQISDNNIIPQGFLRVIGNNIKDSNNQVVHLKGFCLTNGVYTEPSAPPADPKFILSTADYQTIQADGANIVRFYIQYSWLNNGVSANFFTYMDKQLAQMATSNLKAILSLHYFGTGSSGGFYNGTQATITELKTFWKKISNRYSTNNIVAGYDLLNEPSCSSSFNETTLYSYYTDIIDEIRNNNDNHIVYISDPVNKYDNPTDGHFLSGAFKKLADNNVVYQFHWYKPIKFTHQTVYDNPYFQLGATYPYQEATETYTGGWYTNSAKIGNTTGNWVTLTSNWLDVDNFIRSTPGLYTTDKLGASILVGNANGEILIDNVKVERTINLGNTPETVYIQNSDFEIPKRYNVHTTTADNHPANWYLVVSLNGYAKGVEHPAGTLENGHLKFDPSGIIWGINDWATWKTTWWNGYQNYLDYTYGNNYKYRIIMDVKTNLSGTATVFSAFEFYRLTGQIIQNKSFMENAISNYYVSWANSNGVPLYCGEWGVADPSQGLGAGYPNAPEQQVAWINDMGNILYNKGIHWTYHDYKNYDKLGFGVFDTPYSRNEIKQALQAAFQ